MTELLQLENKNKFSIIHRLVMQPFIENSTSNGHVVIDMEKDTNVNGWPPIVLDINNITITKAEGLYNFYFLFQLNFLDISI